jgi:hypothetical protein
VIRDVALGGLCLALSSDLLDVPESENPLIVLVAAYDDHADPNPHENPNRKY